MEKTMTRVAGLLFALVFPGVFLFPLYILLPILLISATLFICAEPIGEYLKAVSIPEFGDSVAQCVAHVTENSISHEQHFYGCNCKVGCAFGNAR